MSELLDLASAAVGALSESAADKPADEAAKPAGSETNCQRVTRARREARKRKK